MCSSYFLEDSPSLENIAYTASHTRLAHHMMNFFGRPFVSQGRVKPADIVPVLAPDRKGEVSIFPMVWGYTSNKSIITTARVENASESSLFRDSWERRRCLIPASWYYDYEHLQISRDPSAAGSSNSQLPEAIRARTSADGSRKKDVTEPYFASIPLEEIKQVRCLSCLTPHSHYPQASLQTILWLTGSPISSSGSIPALCPGYWTGSWTAPQQT